MPLAPPAPIVLPALGEAAKDLVGGLIETLAAPLIILDYLISPGTTATEDKDTIHAPIQQSAPKAAALFTVQAFRPSSILAGAELVSVPQMSAAACELIASSHPRFRSGQA